MWVGEIATETDNILLVAPKSQETYYYPFPRRLRDAPKKKKSLAPNEAHTFIISKNSDKIPETKDDWVCIFSSGSISVYESRKRIQQNEPLHWGLTLEEKGEALAFARSVLEQFLKDGTTDTKNKSAKLSRRFSLHADIDVALWVNGYVRGSRIIEHLLLHEGISRGVVAASRDPRFKPIDYSELGDARIEIAILSPLRVPLDASELEEKEIFNPEKGYLLEMDGRRGWLLPAVFNTKHFSTFQHFLEYLAEEKAGLNYAATKKQARIFQFEVDNFIESERNYTPIDLNGPIAKPTRITFYGHGISPEIAAMNWLLAMQEPDGNLLLALSPLTSLTIQFDLVRSAFTMYAMAEYVFKRKELATKYLHSIENHFVYLKKRIEDTFLPKQSLVYCYAAQEALSLWRITANDSYLSDAMRWTDILLSKDIADKDPITIQQIATLFLRFLPYNNNIRQNAFRAAEMARQQFISASKLVSPVQLALFAELVNVFAIIGSAEENEEHAKFALEVADWLISYYRSRSYKNGGPFPATTCGGVSYTRGVGKIAEVLPLASNLAIKFGKANAPYQEALHDALHWLKEMQYNDANTYFVSPAVRPRLIGGIRHDFVNPEAWIDSVGHFLLALSRIDGDKNYD